MEESKERTFVCKFCNKKFPSGKSLGGHIRIHTNEYSVDSHSYNNRLVGHREIVVALKQQQQQLLCCRERGKGFDSLKALCAHMDSHSEREKMLMDTLSDTETSSAHTRKRSKRMVVKQSDSESFGDESSSSDSEIDQEHKNTALSLMMMSRDSKVYNLVLNSVILETKSSSGEQLKKIFNVKSHVLDTDKVAVDVDQLRYDDDDDYDNGCDSDSYSSDSDYFMNGPKKSDSDISLDGSLKNSLKRFRSIDELGVEMRGSEYVLSKSKRVFLSSDSCIDRNNKIHRTSDSKSSVVKKIKGHECPICFKVFKSGQALGGHKRSHSFENQEHKKKSKHQVTEMHHDQIDLNLVPTDIDE